MQVPEQERPVGYFMARIYRLGCLHLDAELKHLGFGHGSLPFLMTVWRYGSISQNELSSCLFTDKANTARAVRKLLDLEYVQRFRDPDDLRTNIVQLTPKGLKVIPEVKKVIWSWNDVITDGLDKEEHKILYSLLSSILKNATDQP